ncbi:hypothetical protein GQ53DRAFT_742593 [Thozetella sp. PMI_491]|nr:hypothetical protein GQ53DRAFT_742593 [Thozetella sp. PMI_491]
MGTYLDQPADQDGPIYGRLVGLPTDPQPYDRVAAYSSRAADTLGNFDYSFSPNGGASSH